MCTECLKKEKDLLNRSFEDRFFFLAGECAISKEWQHEGWTETQNEIVIDQDKETQKMVGEKTL